MTDTAKIFGGLKLPNGLANGAISLTLSTIIVKLLGLIYKIPLSSILGDEGMGFFNSAYTVYAFFYLLATAGVPKAVMIMLSEAKARGEKTREAEIVSVVIKLFGLLGFLFTLLLVAFASPLATLIGNSKSFATMIFVAPSIIFISLGGVIRGYLNADMRLGEIAVSQVIEGVGRLLFGLMLASLGRRLSLPLEIISALTILGVSFGALFSLVYLAISSKILNIKNKAGQNSNFAGFVLIAKRVLSISVPITVSAAIMSLSNIIDLGLIMNSLKEIGYSEGQRSALYGNYTTLAVPMFNFAIALITPIAVSFLPCYTDCAVRGDKVALLDVQKKALGLTGFIAAPMTAGLVIFSKEILSLLFKNSDTQIGVALLSILAPSILFSSILINVNNMLEASGRVRAPLISMLFGTASKITVSYLLITRSGLGIFGAPIGSLVSYAVALTVSLIIYGCEMKEGLPILSTNFLYYLLAFLSVYLGRMMYENGGESLYFLIFSMLLSGLVYLTFALLVVFLKEKTKEKWHNDQKCFEKII